MRQHPRHIRMGETDFDQFQFRVVLVGTEKEIWRRILVPENLTFRSFGNAVVNAMGWSADYPFSFIFPTAPVGMEHFQADVGGKKNKKSDRNKREINWEVFTEMEGIKLGPGEINEDVSEDQVDELSSAFLCDHFSMKRPVCFMHFGKGDRWYHRIELEKIILEQGNQPPRCIDGSMACPLFHCYEPSEYDRLLKHLVNPAFSGSWMDRAIIFYIGRLFDRDPKFDPAKFTPGFDLETVRITVVEVSWAGTPEYNEAIAKYTRYME